MFFLFKVKRSRLTFLLSSSPLQIFPSLWSGAFRLEKPPTSGPDRWTLVCCSCGSVLLSYTNSGGPCCGTQASPGGGGRLLRIRAALPALAHAWRLQPVGQNTGSFCLVEWQGDAEYKTGRLSKPPSLHLLLAPNGSKEQRR